MDIEYFLRKEDILVNQLYLASNSELINQRRFFNRVLPSFSALFIGTFLYFQAGGRQGALFLFWFSTFAILWFILIPFYQRWAYKMRYAKTVEDGYRDSGEKRIKLRLREKEIKISDGSNSSAILLKELESITESSGYFFIKSKKGNSLVIPKDRCIGNNGEKFIEMVENASGIKREIKLQWKWK